MKNRKTLLALLSIAAILVMLFAFTGCNEQHTHSLSKWENVTEPTCTAFGVQKRTCECSYEEVKTLEALQHTPVTDVAVDATCTTDGKTEGSHCGTCGTILTVQNTICAFGHNCDKVTVLTEADCNVEGSKRFACSNDGCTYYYDESYSLDEVSAIEIIKSAKEYVGCIKTYSPGDVPVKNASSVVISSDGIIVTSYSALNHAFYVDLVPAHKCLTYCGF